MKRLMILASALLLALPGSCGKADVTIAPEEDNTEKQPGNGGSNDSGSVKVLVAYFSFTNTTKGIAASIAEIAGADVYEIVPEVAYGTENSDYYNESTRAYKEQKNTGGEQRPAIKKTLENADSGRTVYQTITYL